MTARDGLEKLAASSAYKLAKIIMDKYNHPTSSRFDSKSEGGNKDFRVLNQICYLLENLGDNRHIEVRKEFAKMLKIEINLKQDLEDDKIMEKRSRWQRAIGKKYLIN